MKNYTIHFLLILSITLTPYCHSPSKNNQAAVSSDSSAPIEDIYWKLAEINGKPVIRDGNVAKEAYMMLNKAEKRLQGNAGCNTISGPYQLSDGNKITLGNIISTKMACPAMDVETQFLQALQTADTYSRFGDTLLLNKAGMAPVAKFAKVNPK
jgi:heat shock protein HslJ